MFITTNGTLADPREGGKLNEFIFYVDEVTDETQPLAFVTIDSNKLTVDNNNEIKFEPDDFFAIQKAYEKHCSMQTNSEDKVCVSIRNTLDPKREPQDDVESSSTETTKEPPKKQSPKKESPKKETPTKESPKGKRFTDENSAEQEVDLNELKKKYFAQEFEWMTKFNYRIIYKPVGKCLANQNSKLVLAYCDDPMFVSKIRWKFHEILSLTDEEQKTLRKNEKFTENLLNILEASRKKEKEVTEVHRRIEKVKRRIGSNRRQKEITEESEEEVKEEPKKKRRKKENQPPVYFYTPQPLQQPLTPQPTTLQPTTLPEGKQNENPVTNSSPVSPYGNGPFPNPYSNTPYGVNQPFGSNLLQPINPQQPFPPSQQVPQKRSKKKEKKKIDSNSDDEDDEDEENPPPNQPIYQPAITQPNQPIYPTLIPPPNQSMYPPTQPIYPTLITPPTQPITLPMYSNNKNQPADGNTVIVNVPNTPPSPRPQEKGSLLDIFPPKRAFDGLSRMFGA